MRTKKFKCLQRFAPKKEIKTEKEMSPVEKMHDKSVDRILALRAVSYDTQSKKAIPHPDQHANMDMFNNTDITFYQYYGGEPGKYQEDLAAEAAFETLVGNIYGLPIEVLTAIFGADTAEVIFSKTIEHCKTTIEQ